MDAAVINISIVGSLTGRVTEMLEKYDVRNGGDKVARIAAFSLLGLMKHRIHQEGKASDGNAIGEYSSGYLRYRQKKGRTDDKKVIASLTGEMENDMSVVSVKGGVYGIGYKNPDNAQKAEWVEGTYDKKIFSPTKSELEDVSKVIEYELNQ